MAHHESFEKHGHADGSKTCRVCTTTYQHEHNPSVFGICEACGYKVMILLLIVMIATSYIAWFGVF